MSYETTGEVHTQGVYKLMKHQDRSKHKVFLFAQYSVLLVVNQRPLWESCQQDVSVTTVFSSIK